MHAVAVGEQPVRFDRQRVGVDRMGRGRRPGGRGHRLQRLPVVEVLVTGNDQGQLRRVPPDQVDEDLRVIGGVDQQGFSGR